MSNAHNQPSAGAISSSSSSSGDPLEHVLKAMLDIYKISAQPASRSRQAQIDRKQFEEMRELSVSCLTEALAKIEKRRQELRASGAPAAPAATVITPARTKTVERKREETELIKNAIENNALPKSRSRSAPQIVVAPASRSPAAKPAPPAAKAAAKQSPVSVRIKPVGRSRSRSSGSGSRSRKRVPDNELEGGGDDDDDGASDEEVELIAEGKVAKPASRTRSRSPKDLSSGLPMTPPPSRSRARKIVREIDDEPEPEPEREPEREPEFVPVVNPEPEVAVQPELDSNDAPMEDAPELLAPVAVLPAPLCSFCSKPRPSKLSCLQPECSNFFCDDCAEAMTRLKIELKCEEHK